METLKTFGELQEIRFQACKYLEFGGDHLATKTLVNANGVTKIAWQQQNGKLYQFCIERGCINCATACLSKKEARCNLYENFEHVVLVLSTVRG